MTMNPLPPQAYTKDTLVQAYSWVQNQNESIKELATTPDVLVSLYLKAKLQGDGALDRPSIQNFKNELRSLAGMMGEFEVVDTPMINESTTVRMRSPQAPPPAQAQPTAAALESAPAIAAKPTASPAQPVNGELDIQTRQALAEVQKKLNLSSESEALRVLVEIGIQQIRKISP